MYQVALADDVISPDVKKVLEDYRVTSEIDQADHHQMIQNYGWTLAQFQEGRR